MAKKMDQSSFHLEWTLGDVNRKIEYRSLREFPDDLWKEEKGSITKEQILNNERLRGLLNKPKNQFVSLPDQRAVARFFYCGLCGNVPFPLSENPTKNPKNIAVYLCGNGHAICQACYLKCNTCTFSMKDYVQVYGTTPTLEAVQQHTKPVNSPLGDFARVLMCSGVKTSCQCALLTEFIFRAEFACKNFYNHCTFRGRGPELQKHEADCAFKLAESANSGV